MALPPDPVRISPGKKKGRLLPQAPPRVRLNTWQILELARAAQRGDERAFEDLCEDFRGLVLSVARDYFLLGADEDDLFQEAWIGFSKAVQSFRPASGTFSSFAALCVRRQIITAVKASTRDKHLPLRDSVRVATSDAGEEIMLVDLLPTPFSVDPCDVLIRRERIQRLLEAVSRLSEVERDALLDVLGGVAYAEMGRDCKRSDNAVQRARRKLALVDLAA